MKSKMQVVLAVCLLIFHGGCATEEGKAEGEIEIVVESSEPEAVPFGADGLYPNPPPKPEGILVVVVEADYSENHPAPDCQKGIPKKTTRSQATHGWRNENVLSLVLLIVVCICTIFTIGLLGTFLHQHRSACSKNTSAPKDSSAPKATSVLPKGHLGKPIITTIPILKLTSSLKGDKKEEDLARLI